MVKCNHFSESWENHLKKPGTERVNVPPTELLGKLAQNGKLFNNTTKVFPENSFTKLLANKDKSFFFSL